VARDALRRLTPGAESRRPVAAKDVDNESLGVERPPKDERQALDWRVDVVAPGGHHPAEAIGARRADALGQRAVGEGLLPRLIETGDRPHLTDDEAPAGNLDEEDAGPRRLGVFEAGVHPLDRLYEMRAEVIERKNATGLDIDPVLLFVRGCPASMRLAHRR